VTSSSRRSRRDHRPERGRQGTILNILSILTPSEGKIVYKDIDITGWPAHKMSMHGISRVYQGNVLFHNLTCQKNVLIGIHGRTARGFWGSLIGTRHSRRIEQEMLAKAAQILQLAGLSDCIQEVAHNLPHGKQRLSVWRLRWRATRTPPAGRAGHRHERLR
jgi:ABC-type branched-subunit amino acid transport system ATPase component